MQQVTILGSTGTIGQQTLDVITRHADKYSVYALAANANVDGLLKQCLMFKPRFAAMLNAAAAAKLKAQLKANNSATQVLSGMAGSRLARRDCRGART